MSALRFVERKFPRRGALFGVAVAVSAAALLAPGCKFTSCADTNSCEPEAEGEDALGGQGGALEDPGEPGGNVGGMGGTDTEPDGDALCVDGEIICDGSCVDPSSDREFCGARGDCSGARAGAACDAGDVCVDGSCRLDCPEGQVGCDGSCIDPMFDDDHCGADAACSEYSECNARQQCIFGTCAQWGEAGVVDFGPGAGYPSVAAQVTIDGMGDARIAWNRSDHDSLTDASTSDFFNDRGSWSLPFVHDDGDERVRDLQMRTNEAGRTVLLFVQESDGGELEVHAVTRDSGGEWTDSATISGTSGGAAQSWPVYFPSLALDEAGNATAAWFEVRDTGNVIVVARLSAGGTDWGSPIDVDVPQSLEVHRPLTAAVGGGQVLLAFTQWGDDGWTWMATASEGLQFPAPAPLPMTPRTEPRFSAALVSNGHDVAISWNQHAGLGPIWHGGYVCVFRDGAWLDEMEIAQNDEDAMLDPADLAIDEHGNLIAAWVTQSPNNALLTARLPADSEEWVVGSTPLAVAPLVSQPALTVDGLGNFHLAFIQEAGGASSVWTARKPAGQEAFTSPRLVEQSDAAATLPAMAFNDSGEGILVWWESESVDHRLGYSIFR